MIKIASKVEDLLERGGIKVRNFLFTAKAHLMDTPLESLSPRLTEPRNLQMSWIEENDYLTIGVKIYLIRKSLYAHQIEIKRDKNIIDFYIIRDSILSPKEPLNIYLEEAQSVQLYNQTKDEKFLQLLERIYSKYGFSEEKVKKIMEYRKGKIRLKDLLTVFSQS